MSAPGGLQQSSAKKRRLAALDKTLAAAPESAAASTSTGKRPASDGGGPSSNKRAQPQQQRPAPQARAQQTRRPAAVTSQASPSMPAGAAPQSSNGGSSASAPRHAQPGGEATAAAPPAAAGAAAAGPAAGAGAAQGQPLQGQGPSGQQQDGFLGGQQHPYCPLPASLLASQLARQLMLPSGSATAPGASPAASGRGGAGPSGAAGGGRASSQGSVDDWAEQLLRRGGLEPNAARAALSSRLQGGKVVALDNPTAALTNKALASRPAHRFSDRLLPRAERQRLTRLRPGDASYALLQPLHELWRAYVLRLLAGCGADEGARAGRLAAADYHGCLLAVCASHRPQWVGLRGLVARATARTFQIVTSDERLHVIPKQGSDFEFELPVAGGEAGKGGGGGGAGEPAVQQRVQLKGSLLAAGGPKRGAAEAAVIFLQ